MLLAAFYYGYKIPAKELIGDIGTYSIDAVIAIAAVLGPWNNWEGEYPTGRGGFEVAGLIVLIPYLLDLGLRTRGRSLGQLIRKLSGIGELTLILALIGFEAIFGLIAVLMYARF